MMALINVSFVEPCACGWIYPCKVFALLYQPNSSFERVCEELFSWCKGKINNPGNWEVFRKPMQRMKHVQIAQVQNAT